MLGKPSAIGYTFLWSIVYGFMISIILTLILMLYAPVSIKDREGLGNAIGITLFAVLISFIAQIWLVFGTAYDYGLVDCPESLKASKSKVGGIYY